MSYILDALRRADAERERGEVPGLQSQQHAMLDDDDAAPKSRPLVWVIVALVLALAAAIAWNVVGGEPPRSAPMAAATTAPVAAPVTATPVAPPTTAPVAVAVPPPPAAPSASTAAAIATAVPAPPPTPAVEPRRTPPPRRIAAASSSPAAAPAAPRPPADDRVYAYADLPEPIRRELPKLAFGGSSYSGSASSRMVILNGQVFHEGDTVAPGLRLRQIKPKAAVLSWRDTRFELSY